MIGAVSKRRKVAHVSSDDDDTSFTSFGDSDEEQNGEQGGERSSIESLDTYTEEGLGKEEHDRTHKELGNIIDDEPKKDYESGASRAKASWKSSIGGESHRRIQRSNTARSILGASGGLHLTGEFKSNIFKLQVDELLDHIRPRNSRSVETAEAALHKLKHAIEQIPSREPLPVQEAERGLLMSGKVVVPFPHPRPPNDARYKLGYVKPANINVVGSHALRTSARSRDDLEIDMTVTIPSGLIQEKDFLNFRYFHKRAYYLACIATSLKFELSEEFQFHFKDFHDDPLKPILAVSSLDTADHGDESKPALKWLINIIPRLNANVFPKDRLAPNKICVRSTRDSEPQLDPFYNASLRADMLMTSYLKLVNGAASSCVAFRDACLLGSTWLRQRGFGSSVSAGGFGNFEWSAILALFLTSSPENGKPVLSTGYSSYQLFKAALRALVSKDMSKQTLVIGQVPDVAELFREGYPSLWDGLRGHNLLYKMSPWSYDLLRQEATTTLAALGHKHFDGFDAAFIWRCDCALLRYDYFVSISESSMLPSDNEVSLTVVQRHQKLYNVLKQGLGDRVKHISLMLPRPDAWMIGLARPSIISTCGIDIGLVAHPETVNRSVDHGPSPENKSEAASFREFWGGKADLRRFKDGSILESLVWTTEESGESVLEQVVRYLLRRHVGEEAEHEAIFRSDWSEKVLEQPNGTAAFRSIMEAYKLLDGNIRALDGLPLSVREIMPANAQLRYASIQLPANIQNSMQRVMPADVTIRFEGSVRWPDDLQAVQRTKIAFLLKLSELMEDSTNPVTTRIGFENEQHDILNQAFLDIVYDSRTAFRLRVYHDRELTLLERMLKNKSLTPSMKDVAVTGLAKHKSCYLKAPAHTQAIALLCGAYPPLSGSIRLLKKWFSSHLLSNHFAEEIIELLVARTFVQPWPWQTPSSALTGFLRTLHWMSRWDWRTEPLIVDLSASAEMKPTDLQAIQTRFEAWRKLDPNLNRVVLFAASNVDFDGVTWTDGQPIKLVAGRMTALAKAAMAELEEKGGELNPASLFCSSLSDYDFLLHLDRTMTTGRRHKPSSNGQNFKNFELESLNDSSMAGFDPLQDLLREMENLYGSSIVFFSGRSGRPVVAGLWNPQNGPRSWKINFGYSTIPVETKKKDEVQGEINKKAILAEIARLSNGIVESIEVIHH